MTQPIIDIVVVITGYGHIAPKTTAGKVVTIFYAILGIPLMLLCLANIGDAMAHSFRFLYWKVCCYACTRKPKKSRLKRQRTARRPTGRQSIKFVPFFSFIIQKLYDLNLVTSQPQDRSFHRLPIISDAATNWNKRRRYVVEIQSIDNWISSDGTSFQAPLDWVFCNLLGKIRLVWKQN